MVTYSEYEGNKIVRCPNCGWSGGAKQLSEGDYHEYSNILDLDCPSCYKHLDFVQFPIHGLNQLRNEDGDGKSNEKA